MLAYMAPEIFSGKPSTKSSDIYSYGITLWEMNTRQKPYANMLDIEIMRWIKNNDLRPPIDHVTISEHMRVIIDKWVIKF